MPENYSQMLNFSGLTYISFTSAGLNFIKKVLKLSGLEI